MDPKQTLVEARKLIETRDKWFGKRKCVTGSELCAGLAIKKLDEDVHNSEALRILARAIDGGKNPAYFYVVAEFNNSHSHAAVLAKFDEAIATFAPKTDISIFTDMLSTPLVEHQSAVDTCGNG